MSNESNVEPIAPYLGPLEVSFRAEGAGTRVTLVHTGWQKLGEKAAESRKGYGEGWGVVLGECFAAACA